MIGLAIFIALANVRSGHEVADEAAFDERIAGAKHSLVEVSAAA